ncbi:MAG TPA: mechanosensitive ion channel family protein [Thermodesulfobacteriota bacterium]|nr:mechanosensitive ion channel family protein [Thermodesulfobacteriota bacterium]
MNHLTVIEQMKTFWEIVVDVWQTGLFGIQFGKLLTASFIFIIFLTFRRLIGTHILRHLKILAIKTASKVDDKALETLEQPIMMIPVALGLFFSLEYLHVGGTFGEMSTKLVRSLIVFIMFWGFYNLVDPLSFLIDKVAVIFSTAMRDWLIRVIKFAFIFIGSATVLEIWGIKIGPILAGLGLLGVAVALGAQDLFKNLISGLLIISEKRFNIGDWILVDGVVEGIVEKMGFRSTVVRRFDKAPVYVPNDILAGSAVTNFSGMTHRRIFWHIGVKYGTTIEQLRRIRDEIELYVIEHDDFVKPHEVPTFVRIDRFSDSSIDIMLYCFTRTTVWGQWLEVKERLALKVKEIVEGAGSSFALPSRTVYMATPAGEKPEPFMPPGNDWEAVEGLRRLS